MDHLVVYTVFIFVDENSKEYVPYKDYNINGAVLTFTTAPANGLKVVVRQGTHYVLVDTITGASSATGDQFGFSIDCDTAGDTLVVGAPYAEVTNSSSASITDAGEAYLFHHIAEKFTADGTAFAFTTTNTLPAQFYVEVDECITNTY